MSKIKIIYAIEETLVRKHIWKNNVKSAGLINKVKHYRRLSSDHDEAEFQYLSILTLISVPSNQHSDK